MVATKERCIFCKKDSRDSRSVEHILPESLGNEDHILGRGIVCDGCNNYFASSVEQPILESGQFRISRLHSLIPNKRRRLPRVEGILLPGHNGNPLMVEVSRDLDGSLGIYAATDGAANALATGSATRMILPATGEPPSRILFSRFLGKVAVECMAQRLLKNAPHVLAEFIDDPQVDQLRKYARYGSMGAEWPYSERRLYRADFTFPADSESDAHEVLHEWTFLHTEHGEMYFVLAILGIEYAINMAGPDIEGYRIWLSEHGNKSPLYL
jgi:hypothetical protein